MAGNATANFVNAQGNSLVQRLNQVASQVNVVVQYGIRYGVTAAMAAISGHTGFDAHGLDMDDPEIIKIMEEEVEDFLNEAEEIVEVTPTKWVVNRLFD